MLLALLSCCCALNTAIITTHHLFLPSCFAAMGRTHAPLVLLVVILLLGSAAARTTTDKAVKRPSLFRELTASWSGSALECPGRSSVGPSALMRPITAVGTLFCALYTRWQHV